MWTDVGFASGPQAGSSSSNAQDASGSAPAPFYPYPCPGIPSPFHMGYIDAIPGHMDAFQDSLFDHVPAEHITSAGAPNTFDPPPVRPAEIPPPSSTPHFAQLGGNYHVRGRPSGPAHVQATQGSPYGYYQPRDGRPPAAEYAPQKKGKHTARTSPIASSSARLLSLPSTPTNSSAPSLPDPIRVITEAELACQMPGCNVSLPGTDTAWRNHFRDAHHNEICAGGQNCQDQSRCHCTCPFADCPSIKPKAARKRMLCDSLGRHLLNVHVGVQWRCPLCGVQKPQRQSACKRHIHTCWKKFTGER